MIEYILVPTSLSNYYSNKHQDLNWNIPKWIVSFPHFKYFIRYFTERGYTGKVIHYRCSALMDLCNYMHLWSLHFLSVDTVILSRWTLLSTDL